MQISHANAIQRYGAFRHEARTIAKKSLPPFLKRLELASIDPRAITAFRVWQEMPERRVDWDWAFAHRYCTRYPKAFDLSVWNGNTLLSLTLGRPTYKGTSMRMDFIERRPKNCLYAGQLFAVSLLAYETYGRLIGAEYVRLVEPMNQKLISYYTSKDGGFAYVSASQGNPHYLVKKL
jgi:hypothetical protein